MGIEGSVLFDLHLLFHMTKVFQKLFCTRITTQPLLVLYNKSAHLLIPPEKRHPHGLYLPNFRQRMFVDLAPESSLPKLLHKINSTKFCSHNQDTGIKIYCIIVITRHRSLIGRSYVSTEVYYNATLSSQR